MSPTNPIQPREDNQDDYAEPAQSDLESIGTISGSIRKVSNNEQRILECLPTNQQAITSLAVERLIGVKASRAKRILKEMTDKGWIEKRGKGIGAYYMKTKDAKNQQHSEEVGEDQATKEGNRFYRELLDVVRTEIHRAQQRAVLSVNRELIFLYWDIGKLIAHKQQQEGWGRGIIPRLSEDIKGLSPEIKGFSPRNIGRMIAFFREYPNADRIQADAARSETDSFLPRAVAKIETLIFNLPWGHNILLLEKVKDRQQRLFYIQRSIEQGWSRSTLEAMCKSQLHLREGNKLSNFNYILPPEQSDLVQQALKDPYIFDFLTLTEPYQERDLEIGLLNHVEKFLLELGVGFAFVGRQYSLTVGQDEYYVDLLFYHFKLRCFVVVELKKGKFKPEYAGKLNFYCNVVDDVLRHQDDQPTVGLILCQDKNEFVAEYAFKGIDKPIGVSEYQLTKSLPKELQSSLPSIEEIEAELGSCGE
jgi:predicted nuclease of restriction endonuclease-like (RecB) superfamily